MPKAPGLNQPLVAVEPSFMGRFEGPLQIPDLAASITGAVSDFAKSLGLDFEAWYHDEPVWLVLKREEGAIRSVQIGAYTTAEGGMSEAKLFFIPSVYAFDERKLQTLTVPQKTVTDYIRSKSLYEIASMTEPKQRKKTILNLLEETWGFAQKFAQSDVREYVGKIPAKP